MEKKIEMLSASSRIVLLVIASFLAWALLVVVRGCVDADEDGVCDKIDQCVGETDECGVCNGYGAIFNCGCHKCIDCGSPVEHLGYHYSTVQIGEQCWFKENLRSIQFSNGEVIPNNLSDTEWSQTTSGAMVVRRRPESLNSSYHSDDESWVSVYGHLYNWYAVDDNRGLCPSGWHVPSDTDWFRLEASLGMDVQEIRTTGFRGNNQASKLKSTEGWFNGRNGTNSSGFSALPGGYRDAEDGRFGDNGIAGYWWSSSKDSWSSGAWQRYLLSSDLEGMNDGIQREALFLRYGFSIRCVSDSGRLKQSARQSYSDSRLSQEP